MTTPEEFFFSSRPSVVRFDCLEISHPDFSQVYRIVRNAPNGLTVTQDADPVTDWLFDGVDDMVEFGDFNDVAVNAPMTLSSWVRTPSVAAQQVIIGKLEGSPGFRGWEFGLESPGRAYLLLSSDLGALDIINCQTVNGSVPTTNTLTHVAAAYDGSGTTAGVKFWVNGVLTSQIAPPGTGPVTGVTLSTAALKMGVRSTTDTLPFEGTCAHTAMWDVELTDAQVLEVYNGGVPPNLLALPTAPDPVFWVKLDETDATGADGIVDHGTGNHDGTANFNPTITAEEEVVYDYYPARVLPMASTDDLVQALSVTLGDVGDVIARETERVWDAGGMNTRPTLTYRAFRSDDLTAPIEGSIRTLEVVNVTTSKEGCAFEARAPELNASRTGELYTYERFPMLRGFA